MSARGPAGAVLSVLLLLFLACAACRTSRPPDGPTAECPVCKHEGDLACLCVPVGPETPRCGCGGVVYYFCSEECRADFAADPQRYTAE